MNPSEGPHSVRWANLPEQSVVEGVTRQRLDTQHMTVLRYRYQPGAHFPAHSHPEEQVVIVIRGQIEFTVAERTMAAGAGSVLVIPPSIVHSARVLGEEEVDTINVLSPRRRGDITFANDAE